LVVPASLAGVWCVGRRPGRRHPGHAAVGSNYRSDFSLPGTESQRALDRLQERAPAQAGATVRIVVQERDGLASPRTRQRVEAILTRVRAIA